MIEFIYNNVFFVFGFCLLIISYLLTNQKILFTPNRILLFISILLLGSSCNITKKIEAGELLVVENKVNIETESLPKEEASSLEYQLLKVPQQKPNKKFFGMRLRLRTYYAIQKNLTKKEFSDTSKFQKFLLEKYIEEPVYYDRTLMENSTETMEYYLNNKGYFDAVVIADTIPNEKKKSVEVVYTAKVGELLEIRKVEFYSDDDTLKKYLPLVQSKTLLKDKGAISKTVFNNEKNRISTQLQNIGFAYFYPNYIFFEGDSTQALLKTDVKVILKPPSDSTFHQRYNIGNTYIFTQYNPTALFPKNGLDTLTVEGFEGFYLMKAKKFDEFWVKAKPILNAFTFRKGDLYSADKYQATRKNLAAISAYRFIRIKSQPNPDNPNLMDFYVYMNPAAKMEAGIDFELNQIRNVNNNSTNINNLGIFTNLNFKHKNIFRGAEEFSINSTTGVELNLIEGQRLLNTLTISVQADLKSPVIRSNNILNGAQSRISLGYNFVNRELNFQNRTFSFLTNIFSFNAGYDWNKKYSKHSFNPVSVSLLSPRISDGYLRFLSNLLVRSLDPQLIIGSTYNYNYQSPVYSNGSSYTFQLIGELAGNSLNAVDQVFNSEENFRFFADSISYSQFALIDLQGSYTKRLSERSALAFRLNVGIGKAFGNSEELPFVRQFFSGGNASIRAWQIRDVGPGGYQQPQVIENVTPFQTGDIKLEFNVEYRFPALRSWGLDGAFFIDAGNVWLFNDPDSLNREFKFSTFYDQIAIGSGFGIRKDFSFFVFRLDLGFKIRTPYVSEMNLRGDHFFLRDTWTQPNYVIAIGYPF